MIDSFLPQKNAVKKQCVHSVGKAKVVKIKVRDAHHLTKECYSICEVV